jgi:hypothetical protein
MKTFWRNEAFCIKPETEEETKALLILSQTAAERSNVAPGFSGEQNGLEPTV